jgi:ubiquinone/menaquinone biosynthesis C-methylase UbiE
MNILSRLTHPRRIECAELETPEQVDAFIDSRALEYSTGLEDDFVRRALGLGVDGGMILDVGTRVGLIALKILWQNENFYALGIDVSKLMVERARETAAAWGLADRAFFQVGDARRMRFKTSYFDLVVSDSTLHCFDDPLSVLGEIGRVSKSRGALLIRDLERPSRFKMATHIEGHGAAYDTRMKTHAEMAIRAAFTQSELQSLVRASGLERAKVVRMDQYHLAIERTGESDPNSWIKVREQYL